MNVSNIHIAQGTDYTFQITWLEDDEPVDLSGWSGIMQIRQTPPSTTVLLSADTNDGRLTLSSEGVVEANFSAADTSAISIPFDAPIRIIEGVSYLEIGVYDIELTDPDDVVMRLVQGKVYLSAEVSR